MRNKSIILVLLFPLLLAGCSPFGLLKGVNVNGINLPNINVPNNTVNDSRGMIPKIVDSLKNNSKEDCMFLAKMYIGLSEYLKNSTGITRTTQILGLVEVVRNDYGWKVNKAKDFTDLIEKDMTDYLDIKKPKDIDNDLKAKMVEAFKVYGEGCLQAANTK